MWLPWPYALAIAGAFVALSIGARFVGGSPERSIDGAVASGRRATLSAFAQEAALVMVLYALWIVAGRLSLIDVEGAFERARWWWDLERAIFLPDEAAVQRYFLPAGWFIQFNNGYYAIVHVPAMIGALIWMWLYHRDNYKGFRNVLALTTAACLIMQLWAVAPPRFLEELEIVDTPAVYGQSVYSALGYQTAGQLQAMPSIHVAWALLIGWYGFRCATGAWRVLGPSHAIATIFVVVVTGNHFWVDGIIAGLFVAFFLLSGHFLKSLHER